MKVEVKLDHTLEKDRVVISTREITEDIKVIIDKLQKSNENVISGHYDGKIYLINPREVNYFFCESQKVFAKNIHGVKIQVKLKLYEIEERLKGERFIRISNSVLANANKIENLKMSFNGVLCIRFTNGDKEYSSRRYVKKIKEQLGI